MNPEDSSQAKVPNPRPSIWDRLLKLDRRTIYVFLVVVVAIPLFIPVHIKPIAMEPVYALFNTVDSIREDKALVISVDYDPSTEAELQPMTIALLRHAFARRIKVGVLSLYIQGLGLADNALTQVVGEFNARATSPAESLRYGKDYVFWGFQTPPLMIWTGMGENISKVFPVDAYKHRTDTLPISEGLRTYNDVGIVVSIAGSSTPLYWITYAQTQFHVKIGTGVTAVSAADFYPFFSKTRQFSGILAGMKGAAEYEEMVEERYPAVGTGIPAIGSTVKVPGGKARLTAVDFASGIATVARPTGEDTVPLSRIQFAIRRRATEAMSSQTFAHFGIMLMIIIGNVAFFASRSASRRKKR